LPLSATIPFSSMASLGRTAIFPHPPCSFLLIFLYILFHFDDWLISSSWSTEFRLSEWAAVDHNWTYVQTLVISCFSTHSFRLVSHISTYHVLRSGQFSHNFKDHDTPSFAQYLSTTLSHFLHHGKSWTYLLLRYVLKNSTWASVKLIKLLVEYLPYPWPISRRIWRWWYPFPIHFTSASISLQFTRSNRHLSRITQKTEYSFGPSQIQTLHQYNSNRPFSRVIHAPGNHSTPPQLLIVSQDLSRYPAFPYSNTHRSIT